MNLELALPRLGGQDQSMSQLVAGEAILLGFRADCVLDCKVWQTGSGNSDLLRCGRLRKRPTSMPPPLENGGPFLTVIGELLPVPSDLPCNLVDDCVFDCGGPGRRQTVINHRSRSLITTFTQDATRRNVRHHVIRVAGDP